VPSAPLLSSPHFCAFRAFILSILSKPVDAVKKGQNCETNPICDASRFRSDRSDENFSKSMITQTHQSIEDANHVQNGLNLLKAILSY
jgi:hypothetical protein